MNRHIQLAEQLSRAIGDLLDRANYKPNALDLKYLGALTDLLKDIHLEAEGDRLLDRAVGA